MDSAVSRPGGRTARTRQAVLQATRDVLAERGYGGLTVDEVAARAGVNRTTVYRRWRSRDGLVVDVIGAVAATTIALPDTGDLEEDLRLFARSLVDGLTGPYGGPLLRALLSSGIEAPLVREAMVRFWEGRFEQNRPLVQRAVDDGRLPAGTDALEVIAFLASPVYYRLLVTHQPLSREVADRAVTAALAAARAGAFVVPG